MNIDQIKSQPPLDQLSTQNYNFCPHLTLGDMNFRNLQNKVLKLDLHQLLQFKSNLYYKCKEEKY